MHRNATPTSANMASHIELYPRAESIMTITFTPMAKIIFCFIRRIVFLDICIAGNIFDGASFIMTASAASTALSLPSPPMAIPTSARASTGASFMPSPVKATVFPAGTF